MSALRPLPPRPNLEFEHKEAKALLRRLRAGEPDALTRARARHPSIKSSALGAIRLADAQLVIAREYGFSSWPRLVRYFGAVERQRYNQRSVHRPDFYESSVRGLIKEHRDRRAWTGHVLASYVPRLYGMHANDVFASTITEDDARLAVARSHGFPSWEVLLERAGTEVPWDQRRWEAEPLQQATKAMKALDLDALRGIVEAHPDLLDASELDAARAPTLLSIAVHHEREQGRDAMRPIMDWLLSHGLDLERELNRQLCGHMYMKTETVRYLLERGADPNWVAPNGISVLEHALISYWNGEAVDLVGGRVTPRKALWISAGLGDVDGVRRFLDRQGKPTPAARKLRPDFDAVGPAGIPSHPDPEDEETLMEAFFVAMLNGRVTVLEYMASRGFPVDSLVWGSPVINVAVVNAWTPVVESLVRCGANLDLRGWRPQLSARELAREHFENMSQDVERRRIVQLCGMDPEIVLAERDARHVNPPGVDAKLQESLELAGDDAFRLGQSDILAENLLFGLLRIGELAFLFFTRASRMDIDRFRADFGDRIRPSDDRIDRPKIPLHPEAQAMIQAAIAIATERRRELVNPLHLLSALARTEDGVVANLLTRYGSGAAILNAELNRAL